MRSRHWVALAGLLGGLGTACGGTVDRGPCDCAPCGDGGGAGSAGAGGERSSPPGDGVAGYSPDPGGDEDGGAPVEVIGATEWLLYDLTLPRHLAVAEGTVYVVAADDDAASTPLLIKWPEEGRAFPLPGPVAELCAMPGVLAFTTDEGAYLARAPTYAAELVAGTTDLTAALACAGDQVYLGGSGVARLDLGDASLETLLPAEEILPVTALTVDGSALWVGVATADYHGEIHRVPLEGGDAEPVVLRIGAPPLELVAHGNDVVWMRREGIGTRNVATGGPAFEGLSSIYSAYELATFGDRVYFGCSADTHGPSRRVCSAPWGGREDRWYDLSGVDIVDLAVDQDYVYTLSEGISDRERILGFVGMFER